MQFENNWVYPWPEDMYDPALKVHLRYETGGPQPEHDDISFAIYYDPNIEVGRYSRAVKPEFRKYLGDRADEPIPFSSDQQKNILTMPNGMTAFDRFPANKQIAGETLRIKMYQNFAPGNTLGLDATETLNSMLSHIKTGNYPVISQHPQAFLLYAFKNYVNLPKANAQGSLSRAIEGAKRIEMCLHSEVMSKVFHLSLQDYPEVEKSWHCISSKELGQ